MSAAQNPHWVTIEEFDRLTAEDEEREFELFEGEVLEVTFPVWKHVLLQRRIAALLTSVSETRGEVIVELPFQVSSALKQVKRRADVAFVVAERFQAAHEANILEGAPDLVIEVLSPSNTASRMNRVERLCLRHGCHEFWTVDPEDQSIRVARDNFAHTYELGDSIPLSFFDAGPLPVDRVFEGIL